MSNYYFIKSKLNGNVIDIQGASTQSGAPLDAWPQKPTGNGNQLWQLIPDPAGSGYYFLQSQLNGNVIDIEGASTQPGALLDAWPQKPTGNDNQLWQPIPDPAGSGYHFLKSKLNGNVIDIQGASTQSGVLLDTWPQKPTGNDNQLWMTVPFVQINPGTPTINSVNPSTAGPGDTIVLNGQNFGPQQGTGYVHFADDGVNWGEPGNVTNFQLLNWSDTQISFLVPVRDTSGNQITPGTTAAVTVTNSGGFTSNAGSLALHSAVKWPVTADSGQTQIGTTGYGFMDTTVTIDQAGNLNANTTIWDTSPWGILTGFHGAVVVRLFDTFGNQIDTFTAGPYGVSGGDTYYNSWAATVPAWVCAELFSISVVNFYDPQYTALGAISNWISANAATIAAAAQAVIAAV